MTAITSTPVHRRAPVLPVLTLIMAGAASVLSIVAIADDDVASVTETPVVVAPSTQPTGAEVRTGHIVTPNADTCSRPIHRDRLACV